MAKRIRILSSVLLLGLILALLWGVSGERDPMRAVPKDASLVVRGSHLLSGLNRIGGREEWINLLDNMEADEAPLTRISDLQWSLGSFALSQLIGRETVLATGSDGELLLSTRVSPLLKVCMPWVNLFVLKKPDGKGGVVWKKISLGKDQSLFIAMKGRCLVASESEQTMASALAGWDQGMTRKEFSKSFRSLEDPLDPDLRILWRPSPDEQGPFSSGRMIIRWGEKTQIKASMTLRNPFEEAWNTCSVTDLRLVERLPEDALAWVDVVIGASWAAAVQEHDQDPWLQGLVQSPVGKTVARLAEVLSLSARTDLLPVVGSEAAWVFHDAQPGIPIPAFSSSLVFDLTDPQGWDAAADKAGQSLMATSHQVFPVVKSGDQDQPTWTYDFSATPSFSPKVGRRGSLGLISSNLPAWESLTSPKAIPREDIQGAPIQGSLVVGSWIRGAQLSEKSEKVLDAMLSYQASPDFTADTLPSSVKSTFKILKAVDFVWLLGSLDRDEVRLNIVLGLLSEGRDVSS